MIVAVIEDFSATKTHIESDKNKMFCYWGGIPGCFFQCKMKKINLAHFLSNRFMFKEGACLLSVHLVRGAVT